MPTTNYARSQTCAAGDTKRLLRTIGPAATKDILFTGRIFKSEEAKEMRLIDRLVPAGTALQAARTLAEQICETSQWSTRATKQMIKGLQSGWTAQSPEAEALFLEGFSNQDFAEGYTAFLAKRKPGFTYS